MFHTLRLRFLALFLIVSPCFSQAANYFYDYNDRCGKAYQEYTALHLEEGSRLIRQELAANPNNLMAVYLADYEDCLWLLINGNKEDYEKRAGHFTDRLEKLSDGDQRSPWYGFCRSGLYFHWAMVNIRFGENLKAAARFRKSFLLVKDNKKRFPSFRQNDIFLGMEEAIVGTIPDDYKWLASIFGMKGDIRKGVGQLAAFVSNSRPGEPLRSEAVIYYCYLRFYLLSQQDEVWNYINSTQFPLQGNLFHHLIKANLALNSRRAEVAIQVLKQAQQESGYSKYPILDYELGSAYLHKLDHRNASVYLNSYLSVYKGGFFVKDALQKLSWSSYLQRDLKGAGYYRKKIARSGTLSTDADKQAQRFSESETWPAASLLQARLLIDGGFYNQALQILQGVNPGSLSSMTDKLEYYFRLGRSYDELHQEPKAVEFYQYTINKGRDRKEHFAARSALQMGMLYEKKGRKDEAVKWYKDCLSMKGHDFQANIDQQAKAGLSRLGAD